MSTAAPCSNSKYAIKWRLSVVAFEAAPFINDTNRDNYSKHNFATTLSDLVDDFPVLSADKVFSYYHSVIGMPFPDRFKNIHE